MSERSHLRKLNLVSQKELANLLLVTRSNMNMYERGERNMPSQLKEKLLNLELAWMEAEKDSVSEKPCQVHHDPHFDKERVLQTLNSRILACRHARAGSEMQLEAMKLNYQKLNCWRQSLQQFSATAREKGSQGDHMWAEVQLINTNRKLESVSPEKQFFLQYRIDTLIEERKIAEKAKEQITRGMGNG